MKYLLLSGLILLSSIKSFAQVSQERKTANLSSFAKAYGYIRYFHPADETSKVNWEEFLYYGIKEVENAKTNKELKEKLNHLFNPIAPGVLIGNAAKAATFNIKLITPADKSFNQEITWQHYGMGTGPGLYRSIRTNRASLIPDMKTSGFGNLTNSIDAKPYRGQKIRLRASIKAEVTSGQAQMWIRVDKENKKIGFFDNMDARPIKKNSWATYETIGTVDSAATVILYGTFLRGLGKMWVDQFSIEVEKNGQWAKVPLNNPSFEESTDNAIQGWNSGSPGYNYSIVSIDAADGKNAALVSDNSTLKIEKEIFKGKPKFGEYFSKSIGNEITIVVPLVLLGSANATYPVANALQLKESHKAIQAAQPPTINSTDLYVRLSGVIITWNVFQHFYPYQEDVNTDWAAQLPFAITGAYRATTGAEYFRLLGELTEKLKDGHVYIFNPLNASQYNIPAATKFVEGKLVINVVDSLNNYPGKNPLKMGDLITFIDGKPALEHFEDLKKVVSGSEQWKNERALSQIFNGAKDSEITLKIKRGQEEEKEIRLRRSIIRMVKDSITIKKMANDIYYINIGTTEMKEIKAKLPELLTAKGIICDLRGYPRNNNELINYLLTENDSNKWMFVPQITYPDYQNVTYEGLGWELKPAKPHLTAKIIFLTAGGAISYAESYMGFIKQYKLATIVGKPTAGANGNVNAFMLPGNYSVRFTGMRVKQQDGSQLQGIGIQPDVFVQETLKGITEGRDEFMEKALELLN